METQRLSRHPECSDVILSEANVILSEAKDLGPASIRSFGRPSRTTALRMTVLRLTVLGSV
jgi:hypothetical protein